MNPLIILFLTGFLSINICYGDTNEVKMYESACLRGNAMACNAAGTIYLHNGDSKKGIELLNTACTHGDIDGCQDLTEIYFVGKTVSKDIKKAKFFAQKSITLVQQKCDNNDAQMCYGMGNLYANGFIKNNIIFVKQNQSKASFYFKKSCNLGYEDSCRKYAHINNITYNEPAHIPPFAEEKP